MRRARRQGEPSRERHRQPRACWCRGRCGGLALSDAGCGDSAQRGARGTAEPPPRMLATLAAQGKVTRRPLLLRVPEALDGAVDGEEAQVRPDSASWIRD